MSGPIAGEGGIFSSAKRLASRLLGMVETRVELFSLELQEEKLRLIQILIWASAAVFLMSTALILLTGLVLLMCWQDPFNRLIALAVMCLLYFAGAIGAALALTRQLKREAMPFAETLGQLKKDRACFKN